MNSAKSIFNRVQDKKLGKKGRLKPMAIDYRFEAPELVRDFLQYHETIKNHSMRTVDGYYIDLRLFLRYIKWDHELVPRDMPFEEIPIRDVDIAFMRAIKKADIYNFLSWLARDRQGKKQLGLGVPARARKLVAVRSFFDYLVFKRDLLEVNPAADIDSPHLRKTLPVYLTEANAVKLLDAVQGPYFERDFCMLLLLLSCGMRVSELAGLNVSDFNGETIRVLGKGNKERALFLSPACQQAVRDYLAVRDGEHVLPQDKDALFLSRNHRRISVDSIQTLVKKTAAAAGLDAKRYSPHKLRHTAATLMLQNGVDVRTLQEVLGHESLNTTQIYTHIDNDGLRTAARANPIGRYKRTAAEDEE